MCPLLAGHLQALAAVLHAVQGRRDQALALASPHLSPVLEGREQDRRALQHGDGRAAIQPREHAGGDRGGKRDPRGRGQGVITSTVVV